MLVSEALAQMDCELRNDVNQDYSTQEKIHYINRAIYTVGSIMATLNHHATIVTTTIKKDDPIPADFLSFAGVYPVYYNNGLFDTEDELNVRYRKVMPKIATETDELPIPYPFDDIVVQTAIKFALNRNEFVVSQTDALIQSVTQAVSSAMASGEH